ncbi:Eco57I restriction-modification methylase domain-containing protein [Marinobacter sp. UBA4489]|nr:Eco57I restriction-modification methylase domain-containing protein [Marinobacter sp. UBA4489]
MATAFVLNLDNTEIGPLLDAIRKLGNPKSRSKPHVTVRYIDRLRKNDLSIYRQCAPTSLEIIGPGSFGLVKPDDNSNKVVFIKCSSKELNRLEHKPHFPDSVFHITMYDGDDSEFAKKLLSLLERYDWSFQLPLIDQRLDEIEIRKNSRKKTSNLMFSSKTKDVFAKLFSQNLSLELLASLSDSDRIDAIRQICDEIHFVAKDFEPVEHPYQQDCNLEKYESSPYEALSWDKNKDPDANQSGLYITPPELATDITRCALDLMGAGRNSVFFGDPAVGNGVFFSILQHLLDDSSIKSAIGVELNNQIAQSTRSKWSRYGLEVNSGDYLHFDSKPDRNLILGNPPYVRFQHIDKAYGQLLREKATKASGLKISGLSGLYVYFILASHSWMREGAIGAWLIPTEFMDTNYGFALRQYLTTSVRLKKIHIYDDALPQFENAKVSSCVVFLEKNGAREDDYVTFSHGGSIDDPQQSRSFSIGFLRSKRRWTFEMLFGEPVDSYGPTLGELFEIKRGIATGANEFFILKRDEAYDANIPDEFLVPLLPKSRTLSSAIVRRDAKGLPAVNNQLFLFDCSLEELELRRKFPLIKKFLDSADEMGIKDRSLIRSRRLWYRQERRDPPPFLCTYMGRGTNTVSPIRFIKNESDALATNTYLLMYPKPRLQVILDQNPVRERDLFDLLQAAEDADLRINLRKYGGGLRKIEPRELGTVRLPTLPEWLKEALENKLDF